jgi:hypothetical protein
MEAGIDDPKVPKETLATIVVPGKDEIEMEPGINDPKVPREVLATVVPGTVNLVKARGNVNSSGIAGKGTANTAAKAPGNPGYVFVPNGRPGALRRWGFQEPRVGKSLYDTRGRRGTGDCQSPS